MQCRDCDTKIYNEETSAGEKTIIQNDRNQRQQYKDQNIIIIDYNSVYNNYNYNVTIPIISCY